MPRLPNPTSECKACGQPFRRTRKRRSCCSPRCDGIWRKIRCATVKTQHGKPEYILPEFQAMRLARVEEMARRADLGLPVCLPGEIDSEGSASPLHTNTTVPSSCSQGEP